VNVALWVIQALVAAAFLLSGGLKAFQPIDKLANYRGISPTLVRFIGVAEILGGLGLILLMLTGIVPALTVAAAVGLVLIMVLAAIFHVSRGEFSRVPPSVVLGILAVVIVYGRLAMVPA
jgi:putative oxidoreductase